jgi:hypothetical protein
MFDRSLPYRIFMKAAHRTILGHRRTEVTSTWDTPPYELKMSSRLNGHQELAPGNHWTTAGRIVSPVKVSRRRRNPPCLESNPSCPARSQSLEWLKAYRIIRYITFRLSVPLLRKNYIVRQSRDDTAAEAAFGTSGGEIQYKTNWRDIVPPPKYEGATSLLQS